MRTAITIALLMFSCGSRPPAIPAPGTTPTSPQVGATSGNPHNIIVAWNTDPTATSYTVFHAIGTGGFSVAGNTTTTQYIDSKLHPGWVYRYYVTATNRFGTSGPSSIVQATAP